MTNNTIPNVPRELMEVIEQTWRIHYQGSPVTTDIAADAIEKGLGQLRALLSAPSPDGVDGLDVASNWVLFDAEADKPYIKKMLPEGFLAFFDCEEDARRAKANNPRTDYKRIDRVKAEDAQAIIDGLRGEVGAQRVKTCIALKERNDAREERDAALAECERLQMQLAACGVVALANTIESAGEARQMHPDYMSASCSDVADAVDREIALRTERDQHAQRIGELEGLLYEASGELRTDRQHGLRPRIDAALSAGKEGE